MQMRLNENYVITNSINVGNAEFVLGVNTKAPNQFVTWECKNGDNYFIGHYFNKLRDAQKDLCVRGLNEAKFLEEIEKSNKKAKSHER